ncbi:glycoside hydrolase family 3 protein [Apiospora sp. TS-2023a]
MANPSSIPSEENCLSLDAIHRYHTLHTNLRSTYGAKWEPWEAFRELVQNWRDGIIKSFRLEEKNFKVIREEKSQYEILYKVPAWPQTDPAKYLGYIRFSGTGMGGRVEIVNCNATIQPSHFDMGGTTKLEDKGQAGEHGDGLKVALLVMMRKPQNHAICFNSGGFRWEPNFDKHDKLVIHLNRLQAYDVNLEERSSTPEFLTGLIPVLATPQEDVKFVIGLGDSVTIHEFKHWTKAALFLQEVEDDGIVSTTEGDLLTSAQLRGKIYLKGLLLQAPKSDAATNRESASITGLPLNFGYNFASGNTNRDRQSLVGAYDEAVAIFAIWRHVLQNKPDLVSELHDMLNTSYPGYADVSQAGTLLSVALIDKLHAYLLSESFEKRWYYTHDEVDKDPNCMKTIQSMGRHPYRLESIYWHILSSRDMVRTANAEKQRRFMEQNEEAIPDTPFSKDIHWYLSACLLSCGKTLGTRFICVRGIGEVPSTMWEDKKNLARIHRNWFLQDQAAVELGLLINIDNPTLVFHTVNQLFRSITEHMEHTFGPAILDGRSRSWYRRNANIQVEQRLLDCIQLKKNLLIQKSGPSHEPKLLVTWSPDAAWKHGNDVIQVEIHQVSTCTRLKNRMLSGRYYVAAKPCITTSQPAGIGRVGQSPATGCSVTRRYYGEQGHVLFTGKENEEYFALITNTTNTNSFMVVSESTVVMPRATTPPPPPPPAVPIVKKRTYTLGEELEMINIVTPRKWYEASNEESQKAVVGIPPEDAPKNGADKTPVKRNALQTPTSKRARLS